MEHKHARVTNFPKNPHGFLMEAIGVSTGHWVDEKGTVDHPSIWQRQPSKLSFEEAYPLINNHKPHWVALFRNEGYLTGNPSDDYWDIGGCNIDSNGYGEVFLWIKVQPAEAEKLFQKHGLNVEWY